MTIDTVAESDFVMSACRTALTVTVEGLGGLVGAAYRPVEEIVPTVELPPVMPFTCQITAVFVVPETITVNCIVVPTITVTGLGGETVTVTPGGGPTGGGPEPGPMQEIRPRANRRATPRLCGGPQTARFVPWRPFLLFLLLAMPR